MLNSQPYSPLLTDFYQLTMAYGYWQLGKHEEEATFHLLFRRHPFKGNYALGVGLGSVLDFLADWHFTPADLAYLAALTGADNNPLFNKAFISMLGELRLTCQVDAMPEGTVVFANEPILRIQGPLMQCQLLESILLNLMNFQTLIATKATRVCDAAAGDPVLEFGMRRAQGPDGALSASRAAYLGGCVATSNALAGQRYGIPVRGTHAHSWVTAFDTESDAFAAYASVMPQQAVLLVDTYNTVQGVKNAIEVGKQLRAKGADLQGIRLDSGDLAGLSIIARELLNEAGFEKTSIIASNSLDEHVIRQLKAAGAKIDAWGVGTNLTTAYDQPALDGVYKMGALKNEHGVWESKIKLSEQEVKISNPGRHQVRRYFKNDQWLGDVIYDVDLGIPSKPQGMNVDGQPCAIDFSEATSYTDLLQPVFARGKCLQTRESLPDIRDRALAELHAFKQSVGESTYPVCLEKKLHEHKLALIASFRY